MAGLGVLHENMTPVWSLRGRSRKALPGCVKDKRGVRLNMANTPKKVKDPTEVALSAIQEALNISDVNADNNRNSADDEVAPPNISSAAPAYSETPFDTRSSDRSSIDRSSMDRSSADR